MESYSKSLYSRNYLDAKTFSNENIKPALKIDMAKSPSRIMDPYKFVKKLHSYKPVKLKPVRETISVGDGATERAQMLAKLPLKMHRKTFKSLASNSRGIQTPALEPERATSPIQILDNAHKEDKILNPLKMKIVVGKNKSPVNRASPDLVPRSRGLLSQISQ